MTTGELAIGLMDSAYFVSKNELLRWVQDTLQLDISFIEDLGSGSVYCQLVDAWYKGAVPMSKVNWNAKFEYEFMANLKLFQQALERIGVTKKVELTRLVKARHQDNLEMIQWLKRFLEMKGSPLEGYNPVARRGGDKLYSHHSQKNSFINKPGKPSMHSTLKKENIHPNKESVKTDKIEKIKRILELKDSAESKLEMIRETVHSKGVKDSARKELKEIKCPLSAKKIEEEAF